MSTRAGGWNGVPQASLSTGESGAAQVLGSAATVIVGRVCHAVSGGPAEPVWLGEPPSAAPEALPRELGITRVNPQSVEMGSAPPPSGAWRVTRTFGGASVNRNHSLVALRKRQASRRESLRVQGLRLERALAEARRVEARRTQARRARGRRPSPQAATLCAHLETGARASSSAPRSGRRALVLASLGLLVAMAPGLASLPLVVRAPATLSAPDMLRSIESRLGGEVAQVLIHTGAEVAEGQVVARLEGAQLDASLALRQRELEAQHQAARRAARADTVSFGTLRAAIERERLALARRLEVAREKHEQQLLQVARYREATAEGLVSSRAELDARAALQASEALVAALGTRLAELDTTLAEHEQDGKRRELERSLALARARAAVDEAIALHALAEVRSPIAGRVESVLVSPGASVRAGEVLARVTPSGAPRRVVAFVPASKARFVHVGMDADVSLEPPLDEALRARARVSRVPADAADADALGDRVAGSSVPVELLLLDDTAQATATPLTRSGGNLLVQLHAGRQRLPVLLFELVRSSGA